MRKIAGMAAMAAAAMAMPAQAEVLWNWSFAGEAGTFTTDGDSAGPGLFTLIDFTVTESAFGRDLGSLSQGDYYATGFQTSAPYTFLYDGSAVTQWSHSGANGFDWWSFRQNSAPTLYHFFGWRDGNVNDPGSASLYNVVTPDPGKGQISGTISINPVATGAVPEPASWALMLLGFAGVGGAMRRRRLHMRASFA